MPGFWRRPVSRMYSYNLDVGEHYYSPMTGYLDQDRSTRGETPGALTFSERLAKKWITGRRYEATDSRNGYERSSSVARETSYQPEALREARGLRAASEMRTAATGASYSTSAWSDRNQLRQQALYHPQAISEEHANLQSSSIRSETIEEVAKTSSSSLSAKRAAMIQQEQRAALMRAQQQSRSRSCQPRSSFARREEAVTSAKINTKQEDNISKKIADIRMHPYQGNQEVREAEAATLRAKARILDLERELDDITKKAIMTGTKAVKSAKQMAYEANMEAEEEAKASSTKKSRKIIMESNNKIIA